MPQSMLAFLALMLVSGMLLSQQRFSIEAQRETGNAQFEVMATAVASERMQYIASHPFDARTADGTVTRANPNVGSLTAPANFGTADGAGCVVASACKDIDDFHLHADTVRYADETEVLFALYTRVVYVDDAGVESAAPTWTKEVTVTVKALPLESDNPYLFTAVEKRRRFSAAWAASESP